MAIALTLTIVAAGCALFISEPLDVVSAWSDGLWKPELMRFGFQSMYMLVLGHVLALSKPVRRFLDAVVDVAVRTPKYSAAYVALLAMTLGWMNWGLGLVAGALVAKAVIDRKVANPGLVGAAGYMGLLVWHSGLSGSAPLKVAESGHLASLYPAGMQWSTPIPDSISISDTVFTSWNFSITAMVILAIVMLFLWMGSTVKMGSVKVAKVSLPEEDQDSEITSVASWLDNGKFLALGIGGVAVGTAIWLALGQGGAVGLGFINPDWINLLLLGAALIAHGSVTKLVSALNKAIGGAAGILLQFPIYFGIMGIVTGTGLATLLAGALVDSTSLMTLPLAIFGSSGLLNIFVPSGGGQWAVQGPLLLEACHSMGLPLEKGVMAMAYGDQWTNMLQPFWALPLLGITGLKARDILPYTMAALIVAGVVFVLGLAFII
jgi:short-chain fatty acids transporter